MSFAYEDAMAELAIDAFVIVHNHLYLMETSIRRDVQQQMEPEIQPHRIALNSLQREIKQRIEPEIEPAERVAYGLWRQRCALQLVCRQILDYAHLTVKMEYLDLDRKIRTEIAERAVIRHLKIKNSACCSAGETDEHPPPLKIQRTDPPIDLLQELMKGMEACALDDDVHRQKLNDLMVYDPKRKCDVPSRFCSIHLGSFDLDDKSSGKIGPPYDRNLIPPGTRLTKYVRENTLYELADYSTEVISVRVVKVGPDYTYPVEVYGTIIARDEIDYKCVYLFNRERKDAQTIKSKNDMLALTGPYRALVTLSSMYFEFDLKIKANGPDDEVEFSKGVISYYFNPDRRRLIYQLPSFRSTVKLVLQHVKLPVAEILKVSVKNKETNDPLVRFDGKITAGTTKNYRHHMVLYDSSVRSGNLVGDNGYLVLNRNLVAVNGCLQVRRAFKKDKLLVMYVCFLDASCEIEDKDKIEPEQEDYEENEEKEEEEDEEKERENVVSLEYPATKAVWVHGSTKHTVEVDWTAVLDRLVSTDCLHNYPPVPKGCEIDYRYGIIYE